MDSSSSDEEPEVETGSAATDDDVADDNSFSASAAKQSRPADPDRGLWLHNSFPIDVSASCCTVKP